MRASRLRHRHAFTLVELLVSTSLAMVLATIATTSFFQFSRMVGRAEMRQAMYSTAQHFAASADRSLSSLQQSCAVAMVSDGAGRLQFAFMRSKYQGYDFQPPSDTNGGNAVMKVNTDLTWELWDYDQATGILRTASNTPAVVGNNPGREFRSGSFSPAGVNHNNQTFINLAKPRRTLDPVDPFRAFPGGLDDNLYFPNSATPPVSLASPSDDLGDYSDLLLNLRPMIKGITDLSMEVVLHDGTIQVWDPAVASTRIYDGVWLDGRLSPGLDGVETWAGSAVSQRPRLLRIRYTVFERRTKATATFSFSFALPGMSGVP